MRAEKNVDKTQAARYVCGASDGRVSVSFTEFRVSRILDNSNNRQPKLFVAYDFNFKEQA
jgi:hypothetical protein